MSKPKRILIAPLNWGLGHATRCIPIIQELIRQGQEVWIASDGRALNLLKREFPQLPALSLPAYSIRYSQKWFLFYLLLQAPKIGWAIIHEHRTVRRWIQAYEFDAVISDNRLGCFSSQISSVVISHQLRIFTRPAWIGKIAGFLHRWILGQYDRCWIPDLEGPQNLSGDLAHGISQASLQYMGPLSRMKKGASPEKEEYDVLVVLSGPEPQRTQWEKCILAQAAHLPYRWLIVQGKPEEKRCSRPQPHIELHSFLGTKALNEAFLKSRLIISRSGYSTIMDLAVLGKKALLVPTPGQPEQEYLAVYGQAKGWFHTQNQRKLDLKKGVEEAEKTEGIQLTDWDRSELGVFIKNWLDSF